MLLICVVLLTAQAAFGHAQLLEISPADGSAVGAPPEAVALRFSEAVQPIRFSLRDAHGKAYAVDYDSVLAESIQVTVPELAEGSYLFSYRVASADGHPIAATTIFSVGSPPEPAGRGVRVTASDESWPLLGMTIRAATLVLVVLSVGLFLYSRLVSRAPQRRIPYLHGAALLIVLLSLVLFLPAFSGMGLAVYGDAEALQTLVRQRVFLAQLLFASAFGLFVYADRINRTFLAAAAVAALVLGKLGSGHTLTTGFLPLASIALGLHVVLAAFWFGALAGLYRLVTRDPVVVDGQLHRFSTYAFPAVVLLIASGVTMSWLIIDDWRNVLADSYGRMLAFKVSLVIAACLIAVVNRYVLMPRLGTADESAVRGLRRNIRTEFVLLLLVIAITSVLAVTTPSSRAAYEPPPQARAVLRSDGYEVSVDYEQAPGGEIRIHVLLDGSPVDVLEVNLRWQDRDGSIEPLYRSAVKQEEGYVAALPLLAVETWQLKIEVLVDDFTSLGVESEVLVRSRP